jgi:hypothetical protein
MYLPLLGKPLKELDMSQEKQSKQTKPVAVPKKEMGKSALKSAKGGLNPQPLPPSGISKIIFVGGVRK